MKRTLTAILLLFVLPASAGLSDAERAELEEIRDEAVRSRAFIRAAETQLSKVIDRIDAMLADEPVVDAAPEPDPPALPDNVLKLPANATLAQVQAALDGDRPVAVAAGSVFDGSLVLPDSTEWLGVHGDGDRPILNVPVGEHGIEATSDRIESLTIEGWSVRGPDALQSDICGIRLRLNAQEGRYAKSVVLTDCEVRDFDVLIEVVDDWARFQDPGTPGRIKLAVADCILANAVGSDSHAAGLYVEGLAEGSSVDRTVIWHVGWTEDGRDPREKRSHCIYAQQFGAPLTVRDSYFGEPSAAALMMRRGGTVERVVISGAATPVVMFGSSSKLIDAAIINHRDIDDTPDGQRIKAVNAWDADRFDMRGVVIARRDGDPLNRPVVAISASVADVRGNAVIAWPSGVETFNVNGVALDGEQDNRVIAQDRGVPSVTPELLDRLMNRQRGETWAEQDAPAAFVKRAQEAIG